MTKKRFTVEKIDLVSDHLSTRVYIKDNLDEDCYDVRHMVSEGFEVQYDTWATSIADKLNELSDENEKLKLDNNYLTILLASIRGLFEKESIVTKYQFEEEIFRKREQEE